MRTRHLLGGLIIGLAATATLSVAQPARPSTFARRYDGFRLLLSDARLKKETADSLVDGLPAEPSRGLVIMLGSEAVSRGMERPLAEFVRRGGTLLLAADGLPANDDLGDELFRDLGISVDSGPVEVPKELGYGQRRDCPIVDDWLTGHPLSEGVIEVAFNRSGFLRGRSVRRATIARLPPRVERDGVRFSQPPPVVAAATLGRGRVLIVADDSVFANEMLLELDNVRFARNAIKWMIDNRPIGSLSVLYLGDQPDGSDWVERRFEEGTWRSPLSELLERLTGLSEDDRQLVNEAVIGMETDGAFNRLANSVRTRLSRGAFGRAGFLVPAVVAALILLFLLWRARSVPAPKQAATESASDARPPARRGEDEAIVGFRRAARELARQLFRDLGIDPVGDAPRPAVHYRGTVAARWRHWWTWRTAWRLARVPPRVVTARRFRAIQRRLRRLLDAIERGDIIPTAATGPLFQQRTFD